MSLLELAAFSERRGKLDVANISTLLRKISVSTKERRGSGVATGNLGFLTLQPAWKALPRYAVGRAEGPGVRYLEFFGGASVSSGDRNVSKSRCTCMYMV